MSIPFFSKLRSQKHYLQLVKPELKQVSEFVEAQSSCFDPEVADYMETVCQSKGKMLRPALVLLVAGATGGIKPAHIRLGALLEMVHLASLVHDDVIDEADKRRDEATANALWGNSLAVLLGDVLFSHAMVLGTEFGSTEFCRRLANTVRNVCQGEVAQSSRLYDLSMTREEYFEILRKKTASLFSAATGGAGWISGVTPEVEESLYQLGDLLGVAYQIYDDFENREVVDYSAFQDNPVFAEALDKAILVALEKNEAAREILWLLPQTEYREALAEMTFYMDELLNDCRIS